MGINDGVLVLGIAVGVLVVLGITVGVIVGIAVGVLVLAFETVIV